jgi:hypothetical protein
VLLVCSTVAGFEADSTTKTAAQPRPYIEISRELTRLMKAESAAESAEQREPFVIEMTKLYQELSADPRLETSDTLQGYRTRLWSRLRRIKDRSQKDVRQTKSNGSSVAGTTEAAPAVGNQGGGAGPPDNSRQLIELIQATIAPGFWNVNGGPGAIYYFSPVHALVVRATSDVHHQVKSGIGGIRAAGM